ncbi:hypothetical protein B0J17DRAFT_423531 [Rhizoctonia solani]|nr:hypothetical protein B0J17DRAFT_423531 [Rhizoctonia solani]
MSLEVGMEGHTMYSTTLLEFILKTTPGMAIQAANIHVVEAQFYKQKKSPRHEFLVFLVRDKTDHTLHNYVALDRNVTITGSGGSFKLMSASSETTSANDNFRISNNRDPEALQQSCVQLGHTCQLIEKITFEGYNFSLGQLAVLASTTTRLHPHYTLDNYNCFWFASTVWDGILQLSHGLLRLQVLHPNKRGKIKNYTFEHRPQVGHVIERYKINLQDFMTSFMLSVTEEEGEEEPLITCDTQPPCNITSRSKGKESEGVDEAGDSTE